MPLPCRKRDPVTTVSAASTALSVSAVAKRFGKTWALKGVDLDISPGEIVALLGPNGAGKTTLISILAGILRPDGGIITRPPSMAHVGYASQEIAIYTPLTVRQNLDYFAGLGRRAPDARYATRICASLSLHELMDKPAYSLSIGQQRRVHVAASLVSRPDLILLDEPTAGVDVDSRAEILRLVAELSHYEGRAVVYSTHYLDELSSLDARIVVLSDGSIVKNQDSRLLIAEAAQADIRMTVSGDTTATPWPDSCRIEGGEVRRLSSNPADDLQVLLGLCRQHAITVTRIDVRPPALTEIIAAWLANARSDQQSGLGSSASIVPSGMT